MVRPIALGLVLATGLATVNLLPIVAALAEPMPWRIDLIGHAEGWPQGGDGEPDYIRIMVYCDSSLSEPAGCPGASVHGHAEACQPVVTDTLLLCMYHDEDGTGVGAAILTPGALTLCGSPHCYGVSLQSTGTSEPCFEMLVETPGNDPTVDLKCVV